MLDGRFGADLPLLNGMGYKTPYGILLPPGGRIGSFVYSGSSPPEDSWIRNNLSQTLAQGLAKCRDNGADTVVVLPGHSENVTDATMFASAKIGTRILGVGDGSLMPTFRWTAVGGNWPLAVAGLTLQGLRLRTEGANGITSAITVTAADCTISDCDIEVASGATAKAAILCSVNAGADRFTVRRNRIRGTETHFITDGFLVGAAVREFVFERNRVIASATAANGFVRFGAAALGVYVGWNTLYNTHTASTGVLNCGAFAADGIVEYNMAGTISTGAQTTLVNGFVINAACLFKFFENRSVNDPRTSGMLLPTVDT